MYNSFCAIIITSVAKIKSDMCRTLNKKATNNTKKYNEIEYNATIQKTIVIEYNATIQKIIVIMREHSYKLQSQMLDFIIKKWLTRQQSTCEACKGSVTHLITELLAAVKLHGI